MLNEKMVFYSGTSMPSMLDRIACLEELMTTEMLYFFENEGTFIIDQRFWEKLTFKKCGIFLDYWIRKYQHLGREQFPPFRVLAKEKGEVIFSWNRCSTIKQLEDVTKLPKFDLQKLPKRPELNYQKIERVNKLIYLIIKENQSYSN